MFSRLNSGGMVTIFPESPLAALPLIVFLPCSSGTQLNAKGDVIGVTAVLHQQMDMI